MKPIHLLLLAIVLAVLFLGVLPYSKFVIQRSSIAADLNMTLIEYNTKGSDKFRERVDSICKRNFLPPGSYEIKINEDRASKKVAVEIAYQVTFDLLLVPHTEKVVLRNQTTNLGM